MKTRIASFLANRRPFAAAAPASSPAFDGSGAPSARRLAIPASLLAMTCALLVAAAPAGAAGHPHLGTFCEPTGLGTAPCDPEFTAPAGMAVDQATGDLLVIDGQELKRFKPNAEPDPFSALSASTNVIDGHEGDEDETPQKEILSTFGGFSAYEAQVAVAPPSAAGDTAGNIYVTDAFNGVVDIFASTGKYLDQLVFTEPCGVAVAPNGDVYVGDYRDEAIHKLVPSTTPTPPPPTTYTETGEFETTAPCNVAAGAGPTEGFVFATQYEGPVTKIDSEGADEGETKYAVDSGENSTVSVDPATGRVYTIESEISAEVQEYDASGSVSATETSNFEVEGFSEVQGLAIDGTSGNVYATAGSQVEVYGPLVEGFELTIDTSGGTGTGSVDCEVDGGPTVDEPCEEDYPAGTELNLIPVEDPGSEFTEFENATGSAETVCEHTASCEFTIEEATALDAPFNQEPPTATNDPPGTITQASIVMKGHVDNEGAAAGSSCKFVIALEASPGTPVAEPACSINPVTGTANEAVEATATGLTAETKYVYRVVATNAGGTATGEPDETAETLAPSITHTLTITKAGTGDGTIQCKFNGGSAGACTSPQPNGTTVEIISTPNGSSTFAGYSGGTGSISCTGTSNCSFTLNADSSVTATFTLIQRTLTVTKAGTGNGTFQCKTTGSFGACAASYADGATVTIKATPDSHSTFVSWSGCSSPVGNECTVSSINANTTVTGTFTLIQRTLTINKAGTGSGSVTCDGATCAASYADGTKVTLAASAASGSTFAGFSGGGCSGASCTVTMSADTAVTATFTADPVVGPPPPPTCPADPSKCPPPSNQVKLGAAKQKGTAIALKVTVPGPGTLKATGKNLATAKATAIGAGTITLKLKLTGAGKKQLQKKGKLKIKVKIVFTPTGGTPGTTAKTVTFKSKRS